MKRIFYLMLSAALLLGGHAAASAAPPAAKDGAPLWMRYPKISPDGSKIAFSYQGDIYYVPTAGGEEGSPPQTPTSPSPSGPTTDGPSHSSPTASAGWTYSRWASKAVKP